MVEPRSHAGRVAIVTGAARGIGQRIAIKLAARGASLVLASSVLHPAGLFTERYGNTDRARMRQNFICEAAWIVLEG